MELHVPSCNERPIGVLSLCIFVLSVASGCQTSSRNFSRIINEPAPLPEALRASFGKVGVIPDAAPPDPRWSRPMNKPEAMALIAERTFKNIDRANHWETMDLEEMPTALLFDVFCAAPFSLSVGILGGLASGTSEHDLRQAEAAIRKAIREEPLERGLQAKIHAKAGAQRLTNLIAIQETEISALKNSTNLNYQVLAAHGIDSVLLVQMLDHR